MLTKTMLGVRVGRGLHKTYKEFCRQNGLIMAKRIEELMRMDIEQRLIKLPRIRL